MNEETRYETQRRTDHISSTDRHDDRPASIVRAVTDQLAQDGLSDGDGLEDSSTPGMSAPTTAAEPVAVPTATDPAPVAHVAADTVTAPDVGTESAPPRRRRQRVSKWDRPPDPHDWRFFVGNIGKVLIATGLLMFGFVAYQLWGTGIETARAQSALKNEFQELIAQNQATAPVADDPGIEADPAAADGRPTDGDGLPADGATSPTADEPDVIDGVTEPGDDATAAVDAPEPSAGDGTAESSGDSTVAVAEPLEPVAQAIPPIFRGDPLALLEIPAIGRSDIVVPGVSLNDLKDGPGHYPDTPLPGQLGNASIAGHRTTYGAPFFNVDDLVPGDELIVTMLTGDRFVYEVTSIEVVSASDYWVVTTSDPTKAELTLTSCHPKYTARDRIVVHSLLNPAKSSNVGFPTAPYELEPTDDEPIPGDDPVLVADAPAADVPIEEAPDDGSASGQVDPTGDAAVETGQLDDLATVDDSADDDSPIAASGDDNSTDSATAPTGPGADAELDAFSQGWFDDRAAFSQIALWGLALTLISIGAYRISRRFRHDSIGFLVGIFPFLFCLYFFFQNVNRLLPPGL